MKELVNETKRSNPMMLKDQSMTQNLRNYPTHYRSCTLREEKNHLLKLKVLMIDYSDS